MKQSIFFILFFALILSGCNFLGGKTEDSLEDSSTWEEENLDDLTVEEDLDEEFTEDMDEEIMSEKDMDEEDMDEEGMDEEDMDEEGMDEEGLEDSKQDKGFFSWLFSGSNKKEDSDEEMEDNLDSEFIGENEDFSIDERNYEDYEVSTETENESTSTQEDEQKSTPSTETADSIDTSTTEEQTQTAETTQFQALNKIMTVPYTKAGQLINAVYIVRPNENLSDISQKIYGRNETDQLLQTNTHLQNRSLVVGDKIYYNSPNRPNDKNQILFYYQDNNMSPSYYSLSPGDNIRVVASQLLGHPKSWKEIWATNPNLESKSEITNSMSIAYWPQSTVSQATYTNPQPETEPMLESEPLPEPELMPNELETANQDNLESPEVKEEFNSPIPETIPPVSTETKSSKNIVGELLNNIEIIIGFILFLIILFLIIRIILKKRKQRDFDYTATNIEV